MSNKNLLLIDTRIPDLNGVIISIKTNNSYILVDYYLDTFDTLLEKIQQLDLTIINSVGLIRHGYFLSTYKLLDKQVIPSIVTDITIDDYNLDSWSEIKNFISNIIINHQIQYFDFISCLLDKYPEYHFIFSQLEKQLYINIGASNANVGNIKYGGTWILNLDNHNLITIYFNNNILLYPYLFFIPVVTIQADSVTKYYDSILFNNPDVTYDGFIDDDTYLSLSGTLNFYGPYENAIQVGNYNIIPFGLTSTKYYLDFQAGILYILPADLNISINNYIKIYDGLTDLPDYVVNYSGLIPGEDFSSFTGSIILQGSHLNAINTGTYQIIPSGLASINYNIFYINSTLTIIPTVLLIIANNVSKIYDRIPYYNGADVIYDGFMNNDSPTDLIGTLIYTGDSQGAYQTGTYTITPGGLSSPNYNITFINGSLTIFSNAFFIKANDFAKFYDSLFFTNPTISYTGDVTDLSGLLIYYGTYQTGVDANTDTINTNDYIISASGLYSSNYIVSYYDGNLRIDRAEANIKADDYIKVYDAIPFDEISITYIGLFGNDSSNSFYGNLINLGTSYNSVNIGFYNIIPSGLYSNNYSIIYETGTLIINPAPLYINVQSFTKIYDGTTDIDNDILQSNIIYSISGIINNEIINIYSYTVRYQNQTIGYQFIDISNITISGFTASNYYIIAVPPVVGTILPKTVSANFSGGNKNFDNNRSVFSLLYSLSGIIGLEDVSISSYYALFRSSKVGPQIIDISYVILYGITANNYTVLPVLPIQSLIYQNFLIITWYGGNKIYDSYNNAGPMTYTIAGIMEGDVITISSYIATFRDVNIGTHIVDVSSIVLDGPMAYTYTPPKHLTFNASIYSRYLNASFYGGSKIYDATHNTTYLTSTLSGMVGSEIVTISSYLSRYQNDNVGLQIVDISFAILFGVTANNYAVNPIPFINANIYPKPLIASFSGGNKTYDGTTFPSYVLSSISGIMDAEYQYTTDLSAIFMVPNYNVSVLGPYNMAPYFIDQTDISNNIWYIYTTGIQSNLYFDASGNLNVDISNLYFYDKNSILGPNSIYYDISFNNLIKTNYIYIDISASIIDLNANWIWSDPTITTITTITPYQFQGLYNNFTNNFQYGTIYINANANTQVYFNGLLMGTTLYIYTTSKFPVLIYPGTNILTISGSAYGDNPGILVVLLDNITNNVLLDSNALWVYSENQPIIEYTYYSYASIQETITINSFSAYFENQIVGLQLIDISDITLSGSRSNNYIVSPIPAFNATISLRDLTATFYGGSKIYDSTFVCGPITYSLSGIINASINNIFQDYLEDLTISTFISFFESNQVGYQLIDLSNIILQGSTWTNYNLLPVPSINADIYFKTLVATFTGGSKVYDGTTFCGPVQSSLSGIIGTEYVTISTFILYFKSPLVGSQFIDISQIILMGPTSNNYYLLPVPPLVAFIDYKDLILTFTGGFKIYDSTIVCGPIDGSISGIIGLENITISTYISRFQSNQVGPELIDISNIIIAGPTYTNYRIIPVPAFNSYIYYKNLIITFTGGSKIYDSYQNAGSTIVGSISGIIGLENITISSFIANFQDQNVGLWFIDISNIILSGPTVTNYFILPIVSISGLITKKSLVATFTDGSKTYDKTQTTGTVNGSISGMVANENIFITNFTTLFQNYKAGNNLIDISAISISGYLPTNYYILPVRPIVATIYQRPLTITFKNGNKIYDSTTIVPSTLIGTISNIIISDTVRLNYYYAKFRDFNAGPQFIDISNVSIAGIDISNYYILPVVPTDAYIYPKLLIVNFSNGIKTYDGTTIVNSLKYSLSGIVDGDFITISSYYAFFKNQNAGNQFIDISNIILFGLINNYTINTSPSLASYIYLKYIYALFTGGDKIYDKTLIPSLTLIGTLSGIVNNEIIDIISFSSIFKSYLAGRQRIDISNVILSGDTLINYKLQPIIPIYSYIYQRPAYINFNGGDKIYDATLIPSPINSYITNAIDSDYLPVIITNPRYVISNAGINIITIQNVTVSGLVALNYQFIIQSISGVISLSGIISQRIIQAIFKGGNKFYDKENNTGSISGYLFNIISSDDIIISSFTSVFRNNTSGTQIIDISNIILSGITVPNYYLNPLVPINAYIYQAPLYALFTASDKIYDATNIPYNINYLLTILYSGDNVYLNTYNAFYVNYNAGNRRIDISNASISGNDAFNYKLQPVQAIYTNILQEPLTITFFGGNKIYDATTNVYTLSYTISGIINNQNIFVNSYTAFFRNINTGIQIIDVSNVILGGTGTNNYLINNITPFNAIISQKSINIVFSNLNKTYDGTQNIIQSTISYIINGLAGSDILTISSYTGLYKNYLVGQTFLDISNIILYGSSVNNYILQPIPSLNALINRRLLLINFYGGDKIYDGTFDTGILGFSIDNVVYNEFITVFSYTSKFRNYNIGYQIIDISNIVIVGPTVNNYYLTNQPPITANISPQSLIINFTGINKIYDNTTKALVTNPQIYGLVLIDISNVTISSYYSYYSNKFVENNKTIYISNIILRGYNSNNYIVNPSTVLSYSSILPLQIYLISTGITKIYDRTTNASLSNVYLSGYFIDDINYLGISSYIANYIDINAQYNKLINITNIVLNGLYSYNYYVLPATTIGNIITKQIYTYFIGVNKNYDGSTLATVINISISGIIYPDTVIISSYYSNFINPNVGINKTIIITDISFGGFSGGNYNTPTSYTTGTITFQSSLNIKSTSNNILYGDTSNYLIGTIIPVWTVIPTTITYLLNGIYQNIIISYNGSIYNLYNNNLIPIYTSNYYFTNIAMNDINNGFICGLSGLIITTNTGFNTTTINIIGNYTFNAISIQNNNTAFVVGNNGIIFKTIDGGLTWFIINSTTSNNLNSIALITNNIIFIVGNNGLLLTTTNGSGSGTVWITKIISSSNLNSIAMFDQNNGYIVGNNGTMLRSNNGTLWTNIVDISNNKYTNYNLNYVYILNRDEAIVVGDNGIILRTFNRGLNWTIYTSGTTFKLTSVFMNSTNDITITGDQGLILSYNINPGGSIQLYDNINLIGYQDLSANNTSFIYKFTNFNVKNYLLYAQFIPYQNNLYGSSYSNTLQLTVKPIIYYSISTLYTIYDRSDIIYSVLPFVDQSGGVFNIIDYNGTLVQQQLVTINSLTGQIQFQININVNTYIFTIIYTLNNSSNQIKYNLTVQPNIYYPINITTLIYDNSGTSMSPYYVQPNGLFNIDYSGNYIFINSNTGIINFKNKCPINNYIITVKYTLNNISNTTLYFLNIIPYINYTNNKTIINYLYDGKSVIPSVNLPGGIFTIYDISSNLVSTNQVYISTSGIINFNNTIPVNYYYFNVVYTFNNINNSTIYYLNITPYVLYPETFKIIEYNHTIYDASSIPIYLPSGGIFTVIDISGTLVSQNIVTINTDNGILIFNIADVNNYMFMASYNYNNVIKNIIYNLQIKPTINYSINSIVILYNTTQTSQTPYVNPPNGYFTIVELDNILVQLNYVNINYLTGIITFLPNILVGKFNFSINYNVNNILNSTKYNITVIPVISYPINQSLLLYGISGYSVQPIYNPINGIFTISGTITNPNLITINKFGVIFFNYNINVGIYLFNIYYFINNIYNSTNYTLTVQPIIKYSISTLTLLYERNIPNNSVIPFTNQPNGVITIYDSSNNTTNLVSNYVYVDISGVIYFNPLINVGIYNFIIYYQLNNVSNYTFYNLIIKPNIYYSIGSAILLYDRINNYLTEAPYVNQYGGIFSINTLSNFATIDNYGIITLYPLINIAVYTLTITYTLNNSFNTTNYYITVQPNIYYTISSIIINYGIASTSISPYYIQIGGVFSLYDISNSLIVKQNNAIINQLGIISFDNTIHVGTYNLLINYILKNISNQTTFKYTVIPNIIYSIPLTTLNYDFSGNSIAPIYSELNGIFTISPIINNINIDPVTGIIYFYSNINVGIYYLIITYSLGGTSNTSNYQLNILPTIDYSDKNNILLYDRITPTVSLAPIYQQSYGTFYIMDNVGNLVQNGYVFINFVTGIITFNTQINVGLYSFIVTYSLNNLSNTVYYNLTIKPNVDYGLAITNLNYNIAGYSSTPYYNQPNGNFTINTNTNLVYINGSTGIITFSKAINVGYYQFIITYTLNGISNTTSYELYIIPNLTYSINIKNLIYGNRGQSVTPLFTQTRGYFYIYDLSNNAVQQNGALINILTGVISFTNNINVGIYTLNIQYILNTVSTYFIYYLNVYPTINYLPNKQTILYNNNDIIISTQPQVQQSGGTFYLYDISNSNLVSNNIIYTDLSGYIYFTNYIIVGSYKFNILYTLNNLSALTNYNLNVIPNLVYPQTLNTLLYTQPYYSDSPYYDQSGGIFTFTDISGFLITNNIIIYDISNGTFNFNKNPDVGLYNFIITYTLNASINFVNFIFYILPIFYYNINSLICIYNSNTYSVIPIVNQSGGTFYIQEIINGITIDPITGIINVSYATNLDIYILTIIYQLNSVYSTTTFNVSMLPVCDYNYPYLTSNYNTFSQSDTAIYDPPGGYFIILPNSTDISAYVNIMNDISNQLISINPNNGVISFSAQLAVDFYYLTVYYKYNNSSNNVNFTFIMNPLLFYNPNYASVIYHDISYSVLPNTDPSPGTFIATVPLINLIYTGLSINLNTGVIRFGNVNAGFWTITVKYTFNNVNTIIYYNLQVIADVYYTPPYAVIQYNSVQFTTPPTAKIPNGIFSSTSTLNGFGIDPTTGVISFNNILTGVYYIPITYSIFGVDTIINYTLVVKPITQYSISVSNGYYTYPTKSVTPSTVPTNGIFNATFNDANLSPLLPSITINSISGVIYSSSNLRVGIYNLAVNYTVNNATITVPYTINIYPIFYYPIGLINTNYGIIINSEIPIVNPRLGVFSTPSNFYVDQSSGQILFNITDVGNYRIPIFYYYNGLDISKNYNLIVNPVYYYNISVIEVIINNSIQSQAPVAKQALGLFSYISVSGTLPIPYGISYLSTNDQYINNGVILNGYSGILNFGSKILVGSYQFVLKYTLNQLSTQTNYSIIVRPYINYLFSNLILDYNTTAISSRPIVDQSGGYFYLSSIIGSNVQFNKITIDNNTGIINFNSGINVGLYSIYITYIVSQISNTALYNLTIRPIYYYSIASSTINVNTIGYSIRPTVIQTGGIFYVIDYNNLDSTKVIMDLNTGIITFTNIMIANYTFVLTYVLNNSSINTTYQLTVLPYVSYDINTLSLYYSKSGSSIVPYVPYEGGTFGFQDITSLGIMQSKISIDISSGQIFFASFINSGSYNILIYYIYNGIKNTFPYYLNITPLFEYTISGVVLNYNHKPFTSINPYVNPSKGMFYFSDHSNNYPIKEILLNNSTGLITINKLMVGNYNIGINYYLKQFTTPTSYIISILPSFYYSISSIIFTYANDGYAYSVNPYVDPSGGTFNIVYPINNNLTYNVDINNYGQLKFNKYIQINNYSFYVQYTYNTNKTFLYYSITVQPLFNYNETVNRIFYNNSGTSSIPNIYPNNGYFIINYIVVNTETIKGQFNSISGIIININTGIINIDNNLDIGDYNINLSYIYLNIPTTINYLVQILSYLQYDVSGQTVLYGFKTYSKPPITTIHDGLFKIDQGYNTNGIFIDASTGILTFNQNTNVNYYPIYISYLFLDIQQFITYNLLVIPNIYYDISAITINYDKPFISNYPYTNPLNGSFTTNIGNIDLSGRLYINNINVDKYNIIINYIVNNISNSYLINLLVNPIIYYNNSSINIFSINNYSLTPYTNPTNGFIYLDISVNGMISIDTNGIISFDPFQNIGKYLLNIYYIVNNIIQSTIYYYNIIPYITYDFSTYAIIGNTSNNTTLPDIRPSGGIFNSILPNSSYIDNSGIIFFTSDIIIGSYNIRVNYSFNDLSNNFYFNLLVTPYIFYNDGIFNYGIQSQTENPIINVYGGIFTLEYEQHTNININSINIDISSGIINFNSNIKVDTYIFYVNYLLNGLIYTHTYNLIIEAYIIYPDFNINQYQSLTCSPTIVNPIGGIFSTVNLPDFIQLDSLTGDLNITNASIIGKFTFIITYIFNNISTIVNVNININPLINFINPEIITYLYIGSSSQPIVSISGGIFYSSNLPNGSILDSNTGIVYYDATINVDHYLAVINYLINDVSGSTVFDLTVLPYLNYSSPTILDYGNAGISVNPVSNPTGGVFNLVNTYNNITIDPAFGIITYGSNIDVNLYNIDVNYKYNNIITTFTTQLLVNTVVLSVNFIAEDKVYDGTTNVKFISNKLTGVINNDKVYINTYDANFQSPSLGINIPVFIYNLSLGGPKSNNYILQYDNLATGNIYLSKYLPNNIKINVGTVGSSTSPLLASTFINPLFLISNISISGITGITINPYGIIIWDNTVPINIYNITVYAYNYTESLYINFTLEVTTNLFIGTINVVPPAIPNTYIDVNTYQLQYTSTTGIAYVLNSTINGLVAKFSITAYNTNNTITHYLGESYPFVFNLDNVDPSANLFAYELNDNDTINYDVAYPLIYSGGNSFTAYLIYLSDYTVQNITILPNSPPTFDPPAGTYYTSSYIQVSIISALPNSIIYYSLNGSQPTISGLIYSVPLQLYRNTTIKAFVVTPGYENSDVAIATYIIYYLPCILSKTLIKTPYGNQLIDNLKENDLILTDDNRIIPIIKILKSKIEYPNENAYPICIPKDYFDKNKPDRDTYISQNHAIKLNDNYWIYGGHHPTYFNKLKVKPLYYHILLPNYYTDNLIANNIIIESWSGFMPKNNSVVYKNKTIIKINNNEYNAFERCLLYKRN